MNRLISRNWIRASAAFFSRVVSSRNRYSERFYGGVVANQNGANAVKGNNAGYIKMHRGSELGVDGLIQTPDRWPRFFRGDQMLRPKSSLLPQSFLFARQDG